MYRAHCARCHGDSGKSDTDQARALKVRPLAGDGALARMSPESIASAVRSNAKHHDLAATADVPDKDIEAAAAFVKVLAGR